MPLKNHTNAWSYAVDNYTTEKLQEFITEVKEYVTTHIPLEAPIENLSPVDKQKYEILCLMRDEGILTCSPNKHNVELLTIAIMEQFELQLNKIFQTPATVIDHNMVVYKTTLYTNLLRHLLPNANHFHIFLQKIKTGKIDLQSLLDNHPTAGHQIIERMNDGRDYTTPKNVKSANNITQRYFNQEIMDTIIKNNSSPFQYKSNPNPQEVKYFKELMNYDEYMGGWFINLYTAWTELYSSQFSIPHNLQELIFSNINYTDHATQYNITCNQSQQDISFTNSTTPNTRSHDLTPKMVIIDLLACILMAYAMVLACRHWAKIIERGRRTAREIHYQEMQHMPNNILSDNNINQTDNNHTLPSTHCNNAAAEQLIPSARENNM